MKRTLALALLLVISVTIKAFADDNPHHMTNADGSADSTKCAVCHNEDLSLQRSKLETCTLCHPETAHSGAREHVQASAERVAKLLEGKKDKTLVLPLADDGRIYCGTCHIFHDPAVMPEALLPSGRSPSSSAVSQAVRHAVEAQWTSLAQTHGAASADSKFDATGTRALRLPDADGRLCQHCHGSK